MYALYSSRLIGTPTLAILVHPYVSLCRIPDVPSLRSTVKTGWSDYPIAVADSRRPKYASNNMSSARPGRVLDTNTGSNLISASVKPVLTILSKGVMSVDGEEFCGYLYSG